MRKKSYHFVINLVKISQKATLFMVQIGGLEPPQIAPYAPQAYVSTNSHHICIIYYLSNLGNLSPVKFEEKQKMLQNEMVA